MNIRIGGADEVRTLWGATHSPTENYFVTGINNGTIEFFTVEDEKTNQLVGELYIFWDSVDKEEANGVNRAYLCAFRINKAYRGQKLGSALMNRVFERIKERDFSEITICVDPENLEVLTKMYQSWGFTELVKMQHYDYHCLDQHHNPIYYDVAAPLYLKRLG